MSVSFLYYICNIIMKIINPFQDIEHKVYNRTFMREASADIEYVETSLSAKADVLVKYLKDNFNVDFNPQGGSEVGTIEVSAKQQHLLFTFSKTLASVRIGARDYRSFASTMQPGIGRLVSFLNAIGVTEVVRVTLKKQNVWDLDSEDVFNAFKTAIPYTFSDEGIREVARLNISNSPKPVKISREANAEIGDGRLVVKFDAEILDERHIRFVLGLEAFANDVKVAEILESSSLLNDIIYAAFHDLVTPDIIKLMEKAQ